MADAERELLLVTGMSGAGRSTVADALEDFGWYVVDNIPPQMLRPLIDLAEHSAEAIPKIAAVIDVRGGRLFTDVPAALDAVRATANATVRVLFLDATDAALVRRFEQVRRPHPLQGDGSLLDGITTERARLSELRAASDIVIDTSDLNIHQLANRITEQFAAEASAELRIAVRSFGFKYGLPTDSDMVADARFLPNPFWVESLRAQSGLDQPVIDFILAQDGALEFVESYAAALRPVLEGYRQENKRHATIAIGCTGGRHRSVVIAEELARRLRSEPGVAVSTTHRDLGRE